LVTKTPCAPYGKWNDWNAIEWHKVNKHVKRLQMRIAKAVREEKWGKARALQWTLTHSYYAKLLAVKRVVSNKGKKTPGIDGITWNTKKKKIEAVKQLKRHGYKSLPLRRIYIPKRKNSNKKRPLSIPTMRDRAMQALYAMALTPIAETTADGNSYGFREKRGCHDAIEQCFTTLAKSCSPQWIYEADIKACYDKINHDWTLTNIPMDKKILQSWLKAGYVEGKKRFPTTEGTPQGGIISPILANMTLDGLEAAIKAVVPKGSKVNFIRYADDFIITCISKEILVDKVIPAIEKFLTERGLKLSAEKSHITHIDEGFNFLAQNIRKYKGKLLIKPSKEAVKSHLDEMRRIIKSMWGAKPEALIRKLNYKHRGWVNYHKHIVAKKTFKTVDLLLYNMLKRWAKRRHSNKTYGWVWRKYFIKGTKKGIFSVKFKTDKKGVFKTFQLFRAGEIPIIRHIKVRQQANPYDPTYNDYFKKRRCWRSIMSVKCRQETIYLSYANA